MPQLIVALDAIDESANYVHIDDVRDNTEYYCPCCKGLIKPRAYKKDVKYQVQPHFYHETGGCNEETFVHYICKTWLFEKGCKFIVNSTEYEVEDVLTEKTLHTSFGDYRPDIIVTTVSGKIFYFEIRTTNRKTEHYIPKWDELGNDVVEVDTRYFINQKYKNNIPVFNLIYSDGECFIKSYTRNDYDTTIAERKLQWKRQDKLNYKIQWERLDWFWNELVLYKKNKNNIEDVILAFEELEYEDMDFSMSIIKKINCQNLYDELKDVIDREFLKKIKSYDISPYEDVKFIQESPRVFYIAFQICHVDNCYWFNSYCVKRKVEYYDSEILSNFLFAIKDRDFNNYTPSICPCLKEINELKYKKLLTDENVSFYLNTRIAVHWDYSCERYSKLFENIKYIGMGVYLKGYRNLWDIVRIKNYHKSLSKQEHRLIKQKSDATYINYLKTNFLINHINNCKNKYWRCHMVNTTLEINMYVDGVYVNWYLVDINEKNKYQIFKDVKSGMRFLLSEAEKSFDYGNKRLMGVRLDDK